MKLTKYLLLACSALFVTACSNDDDWNSASDVTVQMASSSISIIENVDLFYVPVEVIGKANGPVRVTVDVTEAATNPAVADKHYIVTSKTVVIPDDKTEIGIEIAATNDMDMNEDRHFTISITSAEGAKIGAQATTDVTIRDDESIPYESIIGKWTYSYISAYDGASSSFSLKIVGVSEGNPNYNKKVYLQGFLGESGLVAEANFNYDEDTKEITLEIPFGQELGVYDDTYDVILFGVDGDYIVQEGSIIATVSADRKSIIFDPYDEMFFAAFRGGQYMGGLEEAFGITMTR